MFCRGMLNSIAIGPMRPRNPPDIKYTGTFFCCNNPISSLINKTIIEHILNLYVLSLTRSIIVKICLTTDKRSCCVVKRFNYFTPGVKWKGWFLMKSRICCNDGLMIWSRAASASLKSILPDIALFVLKYIYIINIY